MTRPVPAVLLALLLSSCCWGGGPPLAAYREDLPQAEILETLRARQARVASLFAEGKGSLRGSKGSDGSFRWQCWAQGTSRMRLTLTHRLKGCLVDVAVEGDQARCYDPETLTLTKGPLQRMDVPGLRQTASLIRLLAGPADGLAWGEKDRMSLDIGEDRRWDLGLNRRFLVWQSAELRERPSNRILARVTFPLKDYGLAGSMPWPMEVVVDQPGETWRLDLKFTDVRLGVPIDAAIFELKVPEGTRVVESP